ncbi:MAG: hypothetical protein ACR5KV_06530 [Wolbachia sp.]
MEDGQIVDETVITKHINSNDVQDGKAMIRTIENDSSVNMKGIIIGDLHDQNKGFIIDFSFQCDILSENSVFQLGMSMRTEDIQQEAAQALMQNDSVRTLLFGNCGVLSIEHSSSSQRNSF